MVSVQALSTQRLKRRNIVRSLVVYVVHLPEDPADRLPVLTLMPSKADLIKISGLAALRGYLTVFARTLSTRLRKSNNTVLNRVAYVAEGVVALARIRIVGKIVNYCYHR